MSHRKTDMQAVFDRDPAAVSRFVVRFGYGGYKALRKYRLAHWLYCKGLKKLALMLSARARSKTGVDIHPAAKIGRGVFIDHGVGVVIGETCEIGDNVTIYQGVTLGGTGKDVGKRHPTIEEGVMISSGAKVLGPITIGAESKIGAGSVVLKNVPPHSTVVGVPGRIVRMRNERVDDLDQVHMPDPIMQEFKRLSKRVEELEDKLGVRACRYSMLNNEVIVDDEYVKENKG